MVGIVGVIGLVALLDVRCGYSMHALHMCVVRDTTYQVLAYLFALVDVNMFGFY